MKKIMTKIVGAFLGVAMTIGIGAFVANNREATEVNAATNATQYTLINNTSDLEVGKSYIITNGTEGTVKAISTASNTNNRKITDATVSADGKITRGSAIMSFTLGGSSDAWTFATENYAGTAGYLSSDTNTSSSKNYLLVVSSAQNATISFSGDAAVINIGPHSSRTLVSYNSSSSIFACYSSGQAAVYLWKEVAASADPSITFSDEIINGEEGDEFSFTYSANNLTNDITWSPASDDTEIINYTVDTTNKTVSGTMLKAGSVVLTATSGSVSDSVTINVTEHITNSKYTITSTHAVSQSGDVITGSAASYSQTYGTQGQATGGNSMTLSITGLTKKVSINKLVLSMRSNQSAGAGSISVKIDGGEADFIAGTSTTVGAGFNTFGDNDSYGTNFRDVTWDNLTYVAKSSIEIKIYCIQSNSLYCESFDIFFEETENVDVVTALTVNPSSWTGYDSQTLEVDDFTVSVTTNGAEGTAVDYTFLGIGYMDGENFVARDANFIYGNPQVADTRLAWKANYPMTAGGDTYLYAYVTLNVSADSVASIAISENMTKTDYFTNDQWERYGLVATATYASGNTQNVTASATYSYYSNSAMTDEVATPEALGVGDNQTIYVKATYEGVSNTAGYAQTVSVSIEHGSLITDPLTVDEAIDMGKNLAHETEKEYYIRGIVREIVSASTTDTYATFYLEDSDETFSFEGFKMKYDANCTNHNELQIGAEVLIKCSIRKFNSTTIENGQNNGVILSISFAKPALTEIVLNKNALSLGIGDEYTLTASAHPLGAELGTVTWSSSNSGVATVTENGKVTGVANGTAIITATSGEISATCNVTVSTVATLQYAGDKDVKANTLSEEQLTETLGLDKNLFNVSYDKNGASSEMALYPDSIRMYATGNTTNGNKITVSIKGDYTINNVLITFLQGYSSTAEISNKSGIVEGNDGLYAINDNEFTVFNNNSNVTNNTQVRISKIQIFYRDATAQEKVEKLNTTTSLAYRYEKDDEGNFSYSDIVLRFGANISKDLWNELEGVTGFGVVLMDGGLVSDYNDLKTALTDMVSSTITEDLGGEHMAIDYFVPIADMAETIGETENSYFWNLRVSVNEADIDRYFTAVAYIKVGDEYVFLNMARESVSSVAKDYLDNRGCTAETAGGSLANLAA